LATAASPNAATIHALHVRAFNMVSAVVKVLEIITTNVVAGLKPGCVAWEGDIHTTHVNNIWCEREK
jgi:hypothetical protein